MDRRVAVIGGGAVGLAISYELQKRGWQVTLLERGEVGRQASWAGAGILSPANSVHSRHPLDRLAGESALIHRAWADEVLRATGIDVGFWACGGCYLARTSGEAATLMALADSWREENVSVQEVDLNWLRRQLGSWFNPTGEVKLALWSNAEWQIRNPHLIQGWRAAFILAGGSICEQLDGIRFEVDGESIQSVRDASGQRFPCDYVCVAGGAWSGDLLRTIDVYLPVEPIRGQMTLFQLSVPLQGIINEGTRYLVPRRDGHVLAGSTMEQAGFECHTTREEIQSLIDFANSLVPELNQETLVGQWAGLRPSSFDGLPYVGRVTGWDNLLVATGHLRSGLQLSTGTARIVADMLEGREGGELERLLDPVRVTATRRMPAGTA